MPEHHMKYYDTKVKTYTPQKNIIYYKKYKLKTKHKIGTKVQMTQFPGS